MTMRKILAVLLCVCALFSVMAVAVAAADPPPPDPPTTTTPTEPNKTVGDQINEAWQSFMSWFKPLYEGVFPAVGRGLALAFEWLLRLVGIGTWTLPWAK